MGLARLIFFVAPLLAGRCARGELNADSSATQALHARLAQLEQRIAQERKDRRRLPPPRLPANSLPLPRVRQSTEYSCGAASLLSVLNYWHAYSGSESALFPFLDTTLNNGTAPESIAEVARMFHLRASYRENVRLSDLLAALHRGETTILNIQAWRSKDIAAQVPWRSDWWDGHYVVLTSIDENYAYFMDPSVDTGYGYMPLVELLDRWHDSDDRFGPERAYNRAAIFIGGKTPSRKTDSRALSLVE